MQRGLRIDRLLRHPVHLDPARGMRGGAPGFRGLRVMVQERQRQRQPVGVGALEAGAADHDVEPVLADIGPDPVPQQFDGAPGAIARQHAGAAEFEKAQIRMTIDQAGYVELVLAVESVMPFRHVLAQQAVGADHRLPAADRGPGGVIDHHQVVADLVEGILVAARQQRGGVGDRGAVLVEHAIAQLLGALHLALALGQPHLQRADPPQRGGRVRQPDRRAGAGQRRLEPGHRRLRGAADILRPQHPDQALGRSRQFAVLHEIPRDRAGTESNRRGLCGIRDHGRSTAM